MRVLAYIPQYVGYNHNAGAELTMHEMLVALRLRGHDVTVLLSDRNDEIDGPYVIDGVKVQPYASKNDLVFHTLDTNVVITHLHAAERATLVAGMRKIPSVQYIHNTHITTHQALEANPSLVVFNTQWITSHFGEQIRSMVLRPPVRPATYKVDRGKSVTLVNLWRNKGVEVFYELAKRNPKMNFLGVCGGYQVQEIPDLPNVTIMDNTGDIREAYRQTKVILMPSAYESYGRVAVEAAASGIPTVASGTRGLREALGSKGIYVDAPQTAIPGGDPGPWTPDQVDAWDKALKRVMSPRGFARASENALTRSQDLWGRTEKELRQFCEAVERLV